MPERYFLKDAAEQELYALSNEPLGLGGFGFVEKAFHAKTCDLLAIKIQRPDGSSDTFGIETSILAHLQNTKHHDNII